MPLTVVAAPTAEPVLLADVKRHCRIETDAIADDELLIGLIAAARQHAEDVTKRALITRTLRYTLDGFPAGAIALPMAPLQSVSSIVYVDTAGTSTTLAGALYTVDADSLPGRVYPAYGETWPATRDQRNAVLITYLAGHGDDWRSVPQPIQQAMLMMIGHWYENREAATLGAAAAALPMAVDTLLFPNTIWA